MMTLGEGADEVFDEMPKWVFAWFMRVMRVVSGPVARRSISCSGGSWMKMKPMILEALSGSKAWIREKTTFVASLASMEERRTQRDAERQFQKINK